MPDAAEIVALMLELDDRRDQRRLGQATQLRILHRLAEPPGKGHLLLRRHFLVAQEDHQMVEKGLADFAHYLVVERARHVDAHNLRAERTGQRPDLDMPIVTHRLSSPRAGRAWP